jgi:hypothetical protein
MRQGEGYSNYRWGLVAQNFATYEPLGHVKISGAPSGCRDGIATNGGHIMKNQGRARYIGALLLLAACFTGTPSVLHAAQAQNPIQAFKNAWKRAREQAKQQAAQQRQQQQQQQTQNPQAQNQPANTQNPSSTNGDAPSQNGLIVPAPAWVPPTDSGAGTTIATTNHTAVPLAPVRLNWTRLPGVLGLHLGMPISEAATAVHRAYPVNIIEKFPDGSWPDGSNPNLGFTVIDAHNTNNIDMNLSFTAPPGHQILWRLYRIMRFPAPGINHQVLLHDLRAKYGRESYATYNTQVVTNDAQMDTLYWLYKEDGRQIPLSELTPFQVQRVDECWGAHGHLPPIMPFHKEFAQQYPGFCSGIVALKIEINANIATRFVSIYMEDVPLAIRTADEASDYLANVAAQQRKKAIEKSKQLKPVL